MTDTSNVIVRLGQVASDLKKIEKQRVDTGAGGTYNAFAVDDVYSNLRPLFAKYGVVVVPQIKSVEYSEIVSRKGAVGVAAHVSADYVFHAPDGSHVTMRFAAEGHDYQDKATNKAVQQAFKYGLIQMFQISTGEVDPDAAKVEERVSPAERRMNAVKTAAWALTDSSKSNDERVSDAKHLVETAISELGEPANMGDVRTIEEWMTAHIGIDQSQTSTVEAAFEDVSLIAEARSAIEALVGTQHAGRVLDQSLTEAGVTKIRDEETYQAVLDAASVVIAREEVTT